ncbi:MAG: alpha/beta hydrolase [Candidatus Eremiobacteraeota bacterium]|nr:alpha/beta hydrolase [Candidatus Eremiobacteraeota bacterium]
MAGRTLEYRSIGGSSSLPAIVFMHEGLGSAALWRDYPDRLCASTQHRGIVYSRYGNGFSETLHEARTPTYMHDEARTVLPQFLRALAIERPVLYGHSDGASIASIFAATFPLKAAAIILEAPHVMVEALSVRSIAEIGAEYREGSLRERLAKYHADVDRTFYGWNDIWLSKDFASWDISSVLPSIVAPALCIQGTDDRYGTLAQIDSIAMRSSGSVDRIILDRCSHAPHRDYPAYVAALTSQWLNHRTNS